MFNLALPLDRCEPVQTALDTARDDALLRPASHAWYADGDVPEDAALVADMLRTVAGWELGNE